ncbi:MAG TPA: hypothetical protein VHG28_24285 [Longimicrobiaceae bacterium]|nr:hypothetical protein [Longimicrobiaceae bacterium]
MIRRGMLFLVWVVAVTLLVVWMGARLAGPAARTGVAMGAGIGSVFQVLSFWMMLALFPGRQLLAFGLGMVGRFGLVAVVALLVLPVAGLPAAPTLFALVAVLFATTLLEPLFLAADTRKKLR